MAERDGDAVGLYDEVALLVDVAVLVPVRVLDAEGDVEPVADDVGDDDSEGDREDVDVYVAVEVPDTDDEAVAVLV